MNGRIGAFPVDGPRLLNIIRQGEVQEEKTGVEKNRFIIVAYKKVGQDGHNEL